MPSPCGAPPAIPTCPGCGGGEGEDKWAKMCQGTFFTSLFGKCMWNNALISYLVLCNGLKIGLNVWMYICVDEQVKGNAHSLGDQMLQQFNGLCLYES